MLMYHIKDFSQALEYNEEFKFAFPEDFILNQFIMNADNTQFNPWRNDDHYKVAHSHPKVFREYLSRARAGSFN